MRQPRSESECEWREEEVLQWNMEWLGWLSRTHTYDPNQLFRIGAAIFHVL